jgi:hypothetical protein
MMWSKHSRRIDPINRSAMPFCHGEAGAIGLSRMPMARSRRVTGQALQAALALVAAFALARASQHRSAAPAGRSRPDGRGSFAIGRRSAWRLNA